MVGLVPFVWGIVGEPGSLTWPVAAVLYWLVLSALWSVVPGILVTTLYHYATHSEASFGFNWQALNHPWIRLPRVPGTSVPRPARARPASRPPDGSGSP